MYKYPHTIENGHGERLTFKRRVTTPIGERVEGDNLVTPGHGLPTPSTLHTSPIAIAASS